MTKTSEIEELLRAVEAQGYWTKAQADRVYEITALERAEQFAGHELPRLREAIEMGRDANYVPDGTEDWMQEDGVPRAYDKARKAALRLDESLPRPPLHTHELPVGTPDLDARLKTIEATLTDVMRRLKALEAKVVDPSV